MTNEQLKELMVTVKAMSEKLSILKSYLIIAGEGIRQQQDVFTMEAMDVLKGISEQLNQLIRILEK